MYNNVTFRNVCFMLASALLLFTLMAPFGCASKAPEKPIVFGMGTWDTQQFMTNVAGYIVEHGYGYQVDYPTAKNVFIIEAIQLGDIDVHMEVAERSLKEPLQKLLDSGQGEIVGISFPGTWQGWLVPTYIIEGDPERGIEASAPDLKSVFDTLKYWELFQDPEDPGKGRFYTCIPGWQCEKTNELKIHAYGLDEYYNLFNPGSDTALASSLVSAYEKREPWFGYYWSPTWVLAKVDMTPLEEPAFDEALWTEEANYACEYPLDENAIVTNIGLRDRAPEVVQFLENFSLSTEQINEALLYMRDNEAESTETALWFLENYEGVWTEWVPSNVAANVKSALSAQP